LLLRNTSRSSSFDPYSLLAEFGFSSLLSQNPIAPIAMGTLTDIEASNALHEFTHQDGMLTEMGLWYLHTFWKHIARVSNEPSISVIASGTFVWEAYWLLAFLLEGQAMFAQLHLFPCDGEASSRQYDFMRRLGLSYSRISKTDPRRVGSDTQKLFAGACKAAYRDGLQLILLDGDDDTEQYFYGYLFFRGVQSYLSHFDRRFSDPETFFVFFCTFLFDNIFQHYASLDILGHPVSALFWRAMAIIRQIPSGLPEVLEPVTSFPDHEVNYALADYITFLSTGRWANLRDRSQSFSQRANDLASMHTNCANVFRSSVNSLPLFHLKVSDVCILSLDDESPATLSMIHFDGGKQAAVSLKINSETASKIRAQANSEGKLLPNLDLAELVSPKQQYEPNQLLQCEFSTIYPVGQHGWEFLCLSTDSWFIFVQALSPMGDAVDDTGLMAQMGIPSGELDRANHDRREAHGRIMRVMQNDPFVRSRALRRAIVDECIGSLKSLEDQFEKLVISESPASPDEESLNPMTLCESARLEIRNLFQTVVMPNVEPRNARRAIAEAVKRKGLEDHFRAYCLRVPLDANGRYLSKLAGPELSGALADCFRHTFFTSQIGHEIGDVGKFL